MKTSWSRTGAALTAAVLGCALAGCSSSGPDWRFQGLKLEKVDESLQAIDAAWKSSVTSGQVKANLPDTARCYYQVVQDKDVTEETLCGPVRFMGDAATSWQSHPLTVTATDAEVGYLALDLGKSGKASFTPGATANPNAQPTRPDGAKADLAVKLDEPPAPAAALGETIPLGAVGTDAIGAEPDPDTTATGKATITTPDRTHTISATVTRSRIGGPADRRTPPAGGSFVAVTTSSTSSGVWSTTKEKPAQMVISTGGKQYPVAPSSSEQDLTGGFAVAVPTDGADAKVGITYDGLTQWVDARTNKRTGTAAAGYYDGIAKETSGSCPEVTSGDSNTKGWVRTFSCTVRLERSAYLPAPETEGTRKTVGWPKDGTVFVMSIIQIYEPTRHLYI
ncbi:MAG: hypothetical protein L0H26_05340, partial [Microlunatus sp.]|nr:hypothetical protein [Microlunatus sp.]